MDNRIGENEFFALEGENISKSVIIPNDEFDRAVLDEQHGIERPFSDSENSIQQGVEVESIQHLDNYETPNIPDMEQCTNCGRKFFIGRLQLHQKTCTPQHPLKTKHGEPVLKAPSPKKKKKKKYTEVDLKEVELGQKLPRWKMEHYQLVQSIQFSREIEKAVKNGMSLKELQAPKNPLEESYVQCEFCQRKFAPYVAERHIPRCKNIFNRPAPPKIKEDGQKKPLKALEKYSKFVGSSIHEEIEELDNEQSLLIHKTSQTLNHRTFKESTSQTRMSQSQQQSASGKSVFLPRIPQTQSSPKKVIKFPSIHRMRENSSDYKPSDDKSKLFCTNCGAKFAHQHKFCGICGKKRE